MGGGGVLIKKTLVGSISIFCDVNYFCLYKYYS